MYMILREGIHSGKVYKLTEDKVEVMHELIKYAVNDKDDYHEWVLYIYDKSGLSEHVELVRVCKCIDRRFGTIGEAKHLRTGLGDIRVFGGFDYILNNLIGGFSFIEESYKV